MYQVYLVYALLEVEEILEMFMRTRSRRLLDHWSDGLAWCTPIVGSVYGCLCFSPL